MLLHDFLSQSARRFPDKTACVTGDLRSTFADLETGSNRLANALIQAGFQRGDRAAVFLVNSLESIISIFGILKAGGAFVVINPTTKSDKLAYMLNDCAAGALITSGAFREAVETVENDVPSLRLIVTCGSPGPAPEKPGKIHLRFEQDLSQFPDELKARRCIDMDLASIIYTSGSTGRPKGVTLTHLNMISAANSITEYLENVPEDIILNVLPLSFDYGLYQALMAAKIGGTLVLEKSFVYPYQVIERIQQEHVTGFPGVPTVFAILLQTMKDLDPGIFDGIRYVTNTGAALPPSHIQRIRALFRKARVYSMYGLTECKRVSYLPPGELDRRPTSVGRGMPNEEVYIVDKNGNRLGPGEVGELVIRGSNVMAGYWNLPEETAKVLRPGRYPWERVLYSGDLFKMDEEGFLYFVSRQDDIIKSRGEKVSPKEVENVIYELNDVQEVVVSGVPDPTLGEAIKADIVLVPDSPLTAADILGHCKKRLENFMVPKYVEFRDQLPKTDSGKLKREKKKPAPA